MNNTFLWPEGTKFVSRKDELDCEVDDQERTTPAGSTWEVFKVDTKAGVWHITCRANGAWICPDKETLERDFTLIPK